MANVDPQERPRQWWDLLRARINVRNDAFHNLTIYVIRMTTDAGFCENYEENSQFYRQFGKLETADFKQLKARYENTRDSVDMMLKSVSVALNMPRNLMSRGTSSGYW